MLFFEKSADGQVLVDDPLGWGDVGETVQMGCDGCHTPATFHDTRDGRDWPNSLGAKWTPRNTPTVINSAYYKWLDQDGHADSMWQQAVSAYEASTQQNGSRLRIAHVIWEKYRTEYEELFGPLPPELAPGHPEGSRFPALGKPGHPDWEAMLPADQAAVNLIASRYGKAVAAYERLLVSGDAPFDAYVAGDSRAIDESSKRGLKLFIGKAACVECHSGPLFTDDTFRNTMVPQTGAQAPEEDCGLTVALPKVLEGFWNVESQFSDEPNTGKLEEFRKYASEGETDGRFRVSMLRGVAETGPWFHAGQAATLEEVVRHYNDPDLGAAYCGKGDPLMVPLNLSEQEVDDLVAF